MVVPWARGVGVMLLFVLVTARFWFGFSRQGWSPALPKEDDLRSYELRFREAGFGFVARRGGLYRHGEMCWDSSLRSEWQSLTVGASLDDPWLLDRALARWERLRRSTQVSFANLGLPVVASLDPTSQRRDVGHPPLSPFQKCCSGGWEECGSFGFTSFRSGWRSSTV